MDTSSPGIGESVAEKGHDSNLGEAEFQSDRELSVIVKESSPRTSSNEGPVSKKEVLTPPVGRENKKDIQCSPLTRAMSIDRGILKCAVSHKSNETSPPSNTSSKKTGSKQKSSHDVEERTANELRTTNLTTGSVSSKSKKQNHPSVQTDQHPAPGNLAKNAVGRILPAKTRNKRKLYYNNQDEVHITSGDSRALDLNISHTEEDPLGIFVKEYSSSGDNEANSDIHSPRVRRKRIPFGKLPSEPRRKSNRVPRKEVLRKSIAQHKNVSEAVKSSATVPNADTELNHNRNNQSSPDIISQSILETDRVLRSASTRNSVLTGSRESSRAEGNTVSEIPKPANEEEFLSETNNEHGLERTCGALTIRGFLPLELLRGVNQLRSQSCELDADSEQSPDKPVLLNEEMFLNQPDKEEMIKSGRSHLSTGVPRYKPICRLRPSRIPCNELVASSETSPEKYVNEEFFLKKRNNDPGKEERNSGRSSLSTGISELKSTNTLRPSITSSYDLEADIKTSPTKLVNEELSLEQQNNESKKSGRSRSSAGGPRYELICRLRPSRTQSYEEDANSKPSPDTPVSKKCLLKQQNNNAQKEEILKSGRSSLSTVVPPRKCAYKISPSRKSL